MAKKAKTAQATTAKPEKQKLRLEWRTAAELADNPRNWRIHGPSQKSALHEQMEIVGWAGALLYNEHPDCNRLIDGHLRKSQANGKPVPVLIGSWNPKEEALLISTIDPIAGLAEANKDALNALLKEIDGQSEGIQSMLNGLRSQYEIDLTGEELDEEEKTELTDDDSPESLYLAPFPWFGGKSRIARLAWTRLGEVPNFIEPFFGSGAMTLNRPLPADGSMNFGNETANDFDCLVCNFWRAVQADPKKVAKLADWPVNENDLTARHAWLVSQKDALQPKIEGDPEYFDAKIAGWWAWGMACWIGSGFCEGKGPWRVIDGQLVHLGDAGQGVNRKLVHLGSAGRGVNRKLVHLGDAGRGDESEASKDTKPGRGEHGLLAWIEALSERLRRVRICCGDWKRVCGGNKGSAIQHFFGAGNTCAVFLDPPYTDLANRDPGCYRVDSLSVGHDVCKWAIEHGENPQLRIALCGYEGEYEMPPTWEKVKWKARGGIANQSKKKGSQGKENAKKERVWFSPHCLKPGRKA